MNRLNNNEDICARRHKGNAESVEAFASISPEALSAQEQKVYSCSCQYTGGLTGDEIAGILQMPHQSVSARLSGLQKKGEPPRADPEYLIEDCVRWTDNRGFKQPTA